ncbi:ECF transporter S component [Bacillus sp. V2I10]|uniref:ECF transporter S component n=1 Tax=Bacillus sp. V2I10 TaxID=3042276 RepID=UPI002789DA1C|nr:ECF transporter S component [Bacillus sp. V2I10]MDQ0858578.1 energy-coupling factor transport system substrate-specific component [Bacillus sp. V2I10]
MTTRRISLLSLLIALSVVGRMAFQFVPNVQPMTAIILITSILIGPVNGMIVAVLGCFLSNLLLGMGTWTIWQMLAWGTLALLSGLLGKYVKSNRLIIFTPISVLSGYLFGFVVSLNMFVLTDHGLAYYLAGLPFDTAHAIGNGIFFLLLYPVMRKTFEYYLNKKDYGITMQ